jgi:hypothetical protein
MYYYLFQKRGRISISEIAFDRNKVEIYDFHRLKEQINCIKFYISDQSDKFSKDLLSNFLLKSKLYIGYYGEILLKNQKKSQFFVGKSAGDRQ